MPLELRSRDQRDEILAWLGASSVDDRQEEGGDLVLRLERELRVPRVAEKPLDPFDKLSLVLVRHAEETCDDQHRQAPRVFRHKVELTSAREAVDQAIGDRPQQTFGVATDG